MVKQTFDMIYTLLFIPFHLGNNNVELFGSKMHVGDDFYSIFNFPMGICRTLRI